MQIHKNQLYQQQPPGSQHISDGPTLKGPPSGTGSQLKQSFHVSVQNQSSTTHHQPSKSQGMIQSTSAAGGNGQFIQLNAANKAQLLEMMAAKHVLSTQGGNIPTDHQASFHTASAGGSGTTGGQRLQAPSSSQQQRKKQQHSSADAHAGGNPLNAFLGKAQQQLQIQQQAAKLMQIAQNAASNSHADDNLNCESIEEEVIQAVRGGGSGNQVFFNQGKSQEYEINENQSISEERKRIISNKGGSIIVASQAAANSIIQDMGNNNKNASKINNYHSNPAKKTTASQNKFDIKAIVAAGQDGCHSRRTQSRERSNPTSSQGFQILNQGQNHQQMSMGMSQHHHTNSSGQAKSHSKEAYGDRKLQKLSGNQIIGHQPSGGGLFSSFFSQPQEHYEFMTKTLGCNPGSSSGGGMHAQQIQINQGGAPPGTGKQTIKKSNALEMGGFLNKDGSQIRASDIYNQQLRVQSKQNSNRVSTNMIKTPGQGALGSSGGQILFKSFQLNHSNNQPNTRGGNMISGGGGSKGGSGSGSRGKPISGQQQLISGSAVVSNQGSSSLLHTLQTYTQNYYGAQHEKNKKRQPHQSNGTSSKLISDSNAQKMMKNPQSALNIAKRENSETHTLKNSFALNSNLNNQQSLLSHNPVTANSRQQLKFGQIMEELERFSLSNNNNNQLSSALAGYEVIQHSDEWTMGTGEIVTAQSSICESDLEYTNQGNIRASTYKRNEENQAIRMMRKKIRKQHRSEERKKEPSFFTQEYMERRYVNDRVEMELQEFKAEIQKKFEGSKLKDFQFPRIQKQAVTRQQNHIKTNVSSNHNRGYSVEDENGNMQQLPARITLGGKNVIFKTTAGNGGASMQSGKPSSLSQVKHMNLNILDEEFPVEIIKTQDLRSLKDVGFGGEKKNTIDGPSFHQDSLNDQQASFTQDSIVYADGTQLSTNQRKQQQAKMLSNHNNKNQANVLLQNFMKQSFDNRQITIKNGNSGSAIKPTITGYNSTKKQTTKAINISHDNMNFHTFDGPLGLSKVDTGSQNRNANNTVVIQKIIPQEILVQSAKNQQTQAQQHAQQLAEAQLRKQQKQTPKNYSLQLNQVVKKILNDSSGQIQTSQPNNPSQEHAAGVAGGNKALNSASFDQMMYEPSFFTTESYKLQGGGGLGGANHNSSLIQQMYFTKDYQQQKKSTEPIPQSANGPRNNLMIGSIIGEDDNDKMMQSYTYISENKKTSNRTATSTKKTLKVKRSDSNGSQQKNTLLNKIYRSSKTIKSPQSRQSNMNLNNQNPLVHHAVIHNRGAGSEVVRFVKPSQTVNQSNINSTLNSVRQFQIISKQQPLSQSRQGSSGMRAGATIKSTQKGSRLPSSSNKKYHQHTISGSHAAPTITNFQTDTGASFHNYPQSNSNRGGSQNQGQNASKEKKSQHTQILIKSSQIKRTSGERTMRDQQPPTVMKYKVSIKDKQSTSIGKGGQPLLIDSASQCTLLQRSFHNQNSSGSQHQSVANPFTAQNAAPVQILKKQNTSNENPGTQHHPQVKSSMNNSPQNRAKAAKSQSITNKSSQRGPLNSSTQSSQAPGMLQVASGSSTYQQQVQGKIVNLGILNQISNPATNGKGGKITYRNNYPRIGSNSNNGGGGGIATAGASSQTHSNNITGIVVSSHVQQPQIVAPSSSKGQSGLIQQSKHSALQAQVIQEDQ